LAAQCDHSESNCTAAGLDDAFKQDNISLALQSPPIAASAGGAKFLVEVEDSASLHGLRPDLAPPRNLSLPDAHLL
jgi:predicted PhzF superfamily epimerase YddE/YHI9